MEVLQKDTEKWGIAFDKTTKVTGDLKAGSKATIVYPIKATSIEVKPAATSKPVRPPTKPSIVDLRAHSGGEVSLEKARLS
jgi:hypothetical protein